MRDASNDDIPDGAPSLQELIEEGEAVRRVRRERDLVLSPSERLERLHALCADAAAIARAPRRDAS